MLPQPRNGRILPRRTADAVGIFARENTAYGASGYPEWLKMEHRLCERLVRLLNACVSNDLTLAENTSEVLSFVTFGLNWREGDQVVIDSEEFPSNRVVWETLRPCGVKVVKVGPAGDDPEGTLPAAYGPYACLLSISAVQYTSGLRLDLERIGTECRRHGALFCTDAIQQPDALPFDVRAYDCAFAMADGHKWMFGPEGLGVFYCHPERCERLTPYEYGWHILEHALDYERCDWRPACSAWRFECGSPNVFDAMALEASLGLLGEAGMERVDRDIAERVQWLQDGLLGIPGVRPHSSWNPSRRVGILTFGLDGQGSRTPSETSHQEWVICTQRGGGIRSFPHFYTSSTVINDTLVVLRQVAGT